MKSASSLLLGAALATACFLLFASVGRIGERPPPARVSASEDDQAKKAAAVHEVGHRSKQEVVREERAAHSSDGDGGSHTGNSTTQLPNDRIIVIAASPQDTSQDLAELLRRAATEDKKVLMTAINEAWAAPGSFLDLFLESFRSGERIEHLVNHLLVVAVDGKAFARCKAVHPFCYWLKADGLDFAAEQTYMKGDYLEMMWRRNRLQQTVLELGYTFLFTDVDILWFRDPFQHISPSAQLVMSSDFYVGDPNSPGNYPNGGLLYVRSCRSTVKFYKKWRASRARFPGKHEQYVFDKIVKAGVPRRVGTRVQFLDTAYFGGFCQHGKDLAKICTMHANCCVGLDNKLFDLRNVLEDWKHYRARVAAGNHEFFSWRVPGRCIH